MALDFQEVRKQIIELGKRSPKHLQQIESRREQAMAKLEEMAESLKLLSEMVEAARRLNPIVRSAVPVDEFLNARIPMPDKPAQAGLLAADGSQINPDRHAMVDYCLVNVGAIQMAYGSPDTPQTTVRSRLYYDEDMYTEGGRITERLVALMRDLAERQLLAELAAGQPSPIITLTDGPLELWVGREGGLEAGEFKRNFDLYLDTLEKLQQTGASTAGYIDKPRGDLVVRLLEIAMLKATELDQAGQARPFRLVTDTQLFEKILGPNERSAVFRIQSRNTERYAEDLSLHFFYLNVSPVENKPSLARVEVPRWVVDAPGMVDALHAVLIDQCRVLGTRHYPYVLHRSHEVALVSMDEKNQVESMIALELRRQNLAVGEVSHKQGAKNLGGRRRYSG